MPRFDLPGRVGPLTFVGHDPEGTEHRMPLPYETEEEREIAWLRASGCEEVLPPAPPPEEPPDEEAPPAKKTPRKEV